MQDITSIFDVEREIEQTIKSQETPCIFLDVPSMLNESSEKIKSEIEFFNQLVDYLVQNGKQCSYVIAEENAPISWDELMFLEDIVSKSKQEIHSRGAESIIEKARVIEHIVSRELSEIVHFDDEDFYSSCHKNLIQALKSGRASCCHFAALTQYLHLRNNMYSELIYSNVPVDTPSHEKVNHIFNLLFLDDENGAWTFVDTMWEKKFLKLREKNRFSFVTLEDMQNDSFDVDEAHKHLYEDISNVQTVAIDMDNIDKKLGYQNKVCLWQYVYFIAYYIASGDIEKVKALFNPEDETMQNLLCKNSMIQFIGFIAYISAIELGSTGLDSQQSRPAEIDTIQCLDTYLKEVLPEFYVPFFKNRIKAVNPNALENESNLHKYATNLFQVFTTANSSVGVCFNDMLDRAYIDIDFTYLDGFPSVTALNRMQFEKKFGKINDNRALLSQKENCEEIGVPK